MKAIIKHDKITSTMQIKSSDSKINIICAVPDKLTDVLCITEYDAGFITLQTNYGEEYIDLIELIQTTEFSNTFKDKSINFFNKIAMQDLYLDRS